MAAPNAPTLTVSNDGDGDAVTATVAGDAGVTNRLFYRTSEDSAWTAGQTRTGDGDISQTGLTADTYYEFLCVSDNGEYSLPSGVRAVYVTVPSADTPEDNAWFAGHHRLRELLAASSEWQDWCDAEGTETERKATARSHVWYARVPRGNRTDDEYATYLAGQRPFVVLGQGPDWGQQRESQYGFLTAGTLWLGLEADVPSTKTTLNDTQEWFLCRVGDLWADMRSLVRADEATYLPLSAISLLDGPVYPAEEEELVLGDYAQAFFHLRYEP